MSEIVWTDLPGKGVRIRAAEASFAATRAPGELEEAQKAVAVLRKLLRPQDAEATTVDIYLVDPPVEEPGGESRMPAVLDAVGEGGIVRVLAPGMATEAVAYPLSDWAIRTWFSPEAAASPPVPEGLAGVACARVGTGPSVAVADEAVRERLRSGRTVSILGVAEGGFEDAGGPPLGPGGPGGPGGMEMGGGPGGSGGPGGMEMGGGPGGMEMGGPGGMGMGGPLGLPGPDDEEQTRLAATSFVAFLVERFGEEALRSFLSNYDSSRRDQAATVAFDQPLGALEEAWQKSLGASPRKQTVFSFVGYLLPYFKPYWKRQIEVFVYLVIGALMGVVAMPVAIGAVIQALMPEAGPGTAEPAAPGPLAHVIASATTWLRQNPQTRLFIFILVLLVIYGLDALVKMRGAVVGETVAQKLLMSLRERMFDHLQRLPHDFYAKANVGDIMARLSGDLGTVATTLTQVLNMGLYLVISIATAATAALTLDLRLGVAVLLVAPLFILAYKVLGQRVGEASYERGMAEGDAANITQENLSAHAVIKAFGLEEQAVASYHARLVRVLRSALRMVRFASLFGASGSLATTLGQLVVLGLGGYFVLQGSMQVGVLAAFLGLLPSLLQPLSEFSSVGEMVQAATGGMSRVTELLDQPIEIADAPDAQPLPALTHEIKLEGVTFGYEADRPVLHGVDLVLPAGKSIAVVGPSGSGKSSVINLLLRFWDPQEGRVLFDGRDIKEGALGSLRGQIGLVFQETFVFNTTVRENIALGRPGASDAAIEAAAEGARLEEWIASLPGGYDTVLGERGVRMSGGQRQRLAIARVLLRDPTIMILDEATSALDAETETEIQETLQEVSKGRTTIAVTHRLSMAASADLVIVLERGRVVEQGSHEQLVAAGGLYSRLYDTQVRHTTVGAGVGAGATGTDPAILREVPLFSGLDEEALSLVAAQLRPEHFAAGQEVVRAGETGDRMYVIGRGRLHVLAMGPAGPRPVATLSDGDFFGEMSLVTGAPRNATVVSEGASELFSLEKSDFDELAAAYPGVLQAVNSVVSERSAALEQAMAATGAGT